MLVKQTTTRQKWAGECADSPREVSSASRAIQVELSEQAAAPLGVRPGHALSGRRTGILGSAASRLLHQRGNQTESSAGIAWISVHE